jgi:hypothetical protein
MKEIIRTEHHSSLGYSTVQITIDSEFEVPEIVEEYKELIRKSLNDSKAIKLIE